MKRLMYLRHKINNKRRQSSFNYAYDQGYFDGTIEFELGENKLTPILKEKGANQTPNKNNISKNEDKMY